jgi:hypothetical protein
LHACEACPSLDNEVIAGVLAERHQHDVTGALQREHDDERRAVAD